MRVLVAIPHYFAAPDEGRKAGYGSEVADAAPKRAAALDRTIAGLRQVLGPRQWFYRLREGQRVAFDRANQSIAVKRLDIVVVTSGNRHLLDRLTVPRHWFAHEPVDGDPRLLGFACHDVLAEAADDYDWYCYLEDDVRIADPWFLRKIALVEDLTNGEVALMPNRFELLQGRRIEKLYVDGPVSPHYTAAWQDISQDVVLRLKFLGIEISLVRASNPHAGCFFLSQRQFSVWRDQPFFGDRDQSFMGPMESAATLGPMKTFRLFKPAIENAGFLEAEHINNRNWLPPDV